MATTKLELLHPNELGRMTPWQLDFRQLDAGPLSTTIRVRLGGRASLLNIAMNRRVHQRGACPSGWSTFGIAKGAHVSSWQGQELAKDALLAFGDDDGFDGVTTEAFVGNVVSFGTEKLQAFADSCGFGVSGDGPATRLLLTEEAVNRLALLKQRIQNLLFQPDALFDEAEEEPLMIDVLSLLSDSEIHSDKSNAQIRRRAVVRALEIMRANLEEPISIAALCNACGASWRTLDRAFKDRFGLGPKAYYLRLRLTEARQELLRGAPTDLIVEIANRHGFWHMGQFARDYGRFFGELPSQTLRRTS